VKYDEHWRPPWRETVQAVCVSSDCTLRAPRTCIASTMTRGPHGLYCCQCAKRLGLTGNDESPGTREQLSLTIPGL
jgi:hypothetical protein